MTNDPFQIFIIILIMVIFPFVIWASGRVVELMADGEEERVPEILKSLANKEYIEDVRGGRRNKSNKWKLLTVLFGLGFPLVTLCSASIENFIPRLRVVLASATVFFVGVAILEWLVRPRNR